MEQIDLIVPTDVNLEKNFSDFCDEVGMSVATTINIFMKKTVRENKIPFEISADIPNEETREALEEGKRILEHPELYKNYTDVDELMKDLLA